MKTFMLVVSLLTADPSRPTQSRVVYTDLFFEQCQALKMVEYWASPDRESLVSLKCEPQEQVG